MTKWKECQAGDLPPFDSSAHYHSSDRWDKMGGMGGAIFNDGLAKTLQLNHRVLAACRSIIGDVMMSLPVMLEMMSLHLVMSVHCW